MTRFYAVEDDEFRSALDACNLPTYAVCHPDDEHLVTRLVEDLANVRVRATPLGVHGHAYLVRVDT